MTTKNCQRSLPAGTEVRFLFLVAVSNDPQ
jgi:hypothetical protein